MIAAPTYAYTRSMIAPLPVAPARPGATTPVQPFAPFLSSLDVATRRITAARNLLTGPQLMHQTIGQVIQGSVAQAYEGLAALNLAVRQHAPSEAIGAVQIARNALNNVLGLSLRADAGSDLTPAFVNAYNVALNSIHDARSTASVYYAS